MAGADAAGSLVGLEVGEFEFPVGAVGDVGFAADDVFVEDFIDDDGFRENVDDDFARVEGDDAGAWVPVLGEFIGAAVHGEEVAGGADEGVLAGVDGGDEVAAGVAFVELAVDDVNFLAGSEDHGGTVKRG